MTLTSGTASADATFDGVKIDDSNTDVFVEQQVFHHLWLATTFLVIIVPPTLFSDVPKTTQQKGKASNFGNCFALLMHSIQERPGKAGRKYF